MRSQRFMTALAPALVLTVLMSGFGSSRAWGGGGAEQYVALGDGMTAGFADGCLHQDAQLASYASLLARQLSGRLSVRSPGFEQPLMTDPGIPARLEFGGSQSRESLARMAPRPGLGSPVNLTLPRPYDNLAVPGARAGDLLRTSSDGGGFQDLILRGLGSQVEQAPLLEPTLVSLWAGLGDVLGAAISGIVLDGVTMTPADRFSTDFHAIVQTLVAGGVERGVVATVPRPTDLPFVRSLANVVIDSASGLPLEVDASPVPLTGPEGPLAPGDFVLLSASPLLARGDGVSIELGGSGVPLPDEVVLSRAEAQQINRRVAEYNRVIRRAAADVGFAVVEAEALFESWRRQGVSVGAEHFSSDYPSGGLFSLDGVHPSPLGHAFLANAFIEAINQVVETPIAPIRTSRLPGAGVLLRDGSAHRVVFTARAMRNLRFGLGVPRPKRLIKLKQRALRRQKELERRKRRLLFELPAEPKMAALGNLAPAVAPAMVFVSLDPVARSLPRNRSR